MLNRAIQAQLAPGSTFKPFMALAGLEQGIIDEDYRVHCAGGATFYGHYHRCDLKTGHGQVELHRAIMQSCDVYFYNVGNRLGIDTIAAYAGQAGFGRKTGIDMPNEADGVVPSSKWKLRAFRQRWYPGETISVSIGQGALTVTPVQLAAAIGSIANHDVWERPHLLRRDTGPKNERAGKLKPENLAKVVDGMYGVVNEFGTGSRARLAGLEVCGKTGTAQLASNGFLKGKSAHNLKDNGCFVGFAPRKAPEVVVVALFENGEHGSNAAPIVRDVIKAYFDKKARLNKTYRASAAPSIVPAVNWKSSEPVTSADPKNQEIVEVRD
jgi:penicillin-binding protein 2